MTDTKISALQSGGAIQPTDLIAVARNVSGTLTSESVTVGTAAAKTASDVTKTSVASVSGTIAAGHLAVFGDTAGSIIDGGAVPSGGTSGALVAANNLSDLASAPTARTNLGLGALALLSTTSLTANVSGILPIANGGTGASSAGPTAANNVGALAIANNLSDLANASSARTSLGLGSSAVLAAGSANGVATLDGTAKVPLSQLPSAIVNGLEFAGLWNASTNSPTLASGTGSKGTMYKVSTSGTTTLDGVSQWNAGDFAFFDGTTWDKVDGLASEVLSVAGRTGAVVLTTTDISGLGTAAAQNVAAFAQTANNLSDLASVSTARSNLGLGTAATLAAGSANGVATLDSGGHVPVAQIPAPTGRIITAAATLTATDGVVEVQLAAAAPCAITGNAVPTNWLWQTIKDGNGTASPTNPITYTPGTGTIDGQASASINTPYGSMTFYFNGTNTRTVA